LHYYSLNARAEDFGYQPTSTYLDRIALEIEDVLMGHANRKISKN